MSLLAVQGGATGTGTVTLLAPVTNTNQTLTLPDQTATLITDSAAIRNIGSGQVYKDASGNVGIGTATPARRLHVRQGGVTTLANTNGSLFTDAGNVWAVKQDSRVGANFDIKDFYNQMAIGSGLGIRLNLGIFIFRLDGAIPIHDPTFAFGKRWVIENAKSAGWYWDNSIFNFGIGYPF